MDDAARLQPPNLSQLPDDPAALKQLVLELSGQVNLCKQTIIDVDKRLAERDESIRLLSEDNSLLRHRLSQLLRNSYGPRAERFDPRQLLLFGLRVPPLDMQAAGESPKDSREKSANRSRHGRRKLPEHLPRIPVEHDLSEEQKPCPCRGQERHRIGQECAEQLEYLPASFLVLQHVRHKYACKHCNSGECNRCDGNAHIKLADKPSEGIERSLAGPGLLAYVITSKLADHLPLYRIEQIFARQKMEIARSTLCGWMSAAAHVIEPLYKLLCDRVRQSAVLHSDDTTVPVMSQGHCRTGRLWTYVGDESNPYIVYDYTPTRKSDGPLGWLGEWKGYLQADAYAGYDKLYAKGEVVEVACWAHARRKIFEAKESDAARSLWMLELIRRLYAVEEEAKEPQDRLHLRQSQSKPILQQIHLWLQEQSTQVLPRSPIGQAITYALNQWPALCVYTSDSRLNIDNNAAERALRRVAVGRKNWLWAGHDESAQAHAMLWSLIASAQRHGIDVQLYLRSVLARLPAATPDEIELYLPDRWKTDLMAEQQAATDAQQAQWRRAAGVTASA